MQVRSPVGIWSRRTVSGGSKGGTAPRQPLPGTREAWPQRVGWLMTGNGGGIVRDLVSPMWRTTWDAHGMVGNLTDVSTSRVYGCSPLPALVFTPHFLGTESWGLLVDSRGWIKTWSRASRPS